ncbi:MAG TPA: hypothetical protein VLK85_23770, partial [Ramlibacter sp.]|nr:hypothetical protein [Ramlibacter sp.]
MSAANRSLRFRLFLLAASGLLPLALVAGIVLTSLVGERERDARQAALEVSRALATAVDAELGATRGVLQSLALAAELKARRLEDFHALAGRVSEGQGWRGIVLADGTGQVLLNSARPLGASGAQPVDPESMTRAIATRQPVVGRVAEGPFRQGPAFAVRVPVLEAQQVKYVLSAIIPVERVLAVVQRQKVPPTSVVAVFDQYQQRVARSQEHANQQPSPSLQKLLATGAAEGSGETVTLEGMRSQAGYSRLGDSGWVVATGISMERGLRMFYDALGTVAGGLLASLAFSAFLAWYFARGVSEPIDALKVAARALGRGEPVRLPPLEIAELREVGAALDGASNERDRATQERRAAESERERLLARATEALRLAEEAGRSKDEFLAMLGHE